jgi:hypothetical protein
MCIIGRTWIVSDDHLRMNLPNVQFKFRFKIGTQLDLSEYPAV